MTGDSNLSVIMIGGGGHAKVVYDAILACGGTISAYIDPNQSQWLQSMGIKCLLEEDLVARLGAHPQLVMGFVGLDCAAMDRRYKTMCGYIEKGAVFPSIVHPSAVISPSAKIEAGVQIMAGAVINSHAVIKEGAVINSGAVVEHDAHIGAGVHIAPRAVVLGGARVGDLSYVGSNAVIVQNIAVKPKTFVKALSVVASQS